MDILSLNKSKAKLIAGGVVKPSQITTGVIQVETIASGAELPVITGGGIVDSDTPVTPTVRYTLTINALPANAIVMINGVKSNTASIVENMTARYTVTADGYISQSGEIVMTQDQTITVELVEIPKYTFSISPVPSNAVVTINGEVRNSVTVLGGTEIAWSVEAENYIAQSGNLVLTENINLNVSLEKVKYTFTINATPSNAVVKINGENVNSITAVGGTEISYEVSADGYITEVGELTLTENKTIDVALKAIPKYTFTIIPTPSNAVVTINGVQRSSVIAYENTVVDWSVEADGYTGQSGTHTLVADYTLEVSLEAASSSETKTFSATTATTWLVDKNGDLYGCGRSNYGEQGISYTSNVRRFTERANGVTSFAACANTTWYIDNNGDLYGCGQNNYGQQGTSSTSNVTTFTERASNVKSVFSAPLYGFTTWYIDNDGNLYGCGQNTNGQQGSGSTTNVKTFTKRASNVREVSASTNTTWYIDNDGNLYGCGYNSSGQQGSGTTDDVKTFTKRASNVKSVFASNNTTWYIDNDGNLYGCGYNSYGQQGNGTTDDVLRFTKRASGVKSFSASANFTWYLTEAGDLYGCGYNKYGQQSDGTTTNVTRFTKRASNIKTVYATDNSSWYVDENDNLYGCGYNSYGQQGNGTTDDVLRFTKRASGVKNVYLSNYTTWYEDKNDGLYGCGGNSYGQQGNGTVDNVLTFTKVSI